VAEAAPSIPGPPASPRIPRATPRASSVPPPPRTPSTLPAPPPSTPEVAPASSPAPASSASPSSSSTRAAKVPSSPVIEIPKAYASAPPVIRDVLLEIDDDDVVEDVARTPPPLKRRPAISPLAIVVPQPITVRSHPTPPGTYLAPAPTPLAIVPDRIAPLPPKAPTIESSVVDVDLSDRVARPVESREESPPESRIVPSSSSPRLESSLDPMDLLFDGVYELNFVDTAIEAADVCARALAKALRARAVVIHAHDLVARTLRTIGTFGGPPELLGSSASSDDDLVGAAVICNERPVTMRFGGELPRVAPRRLEVVGAPRTLVAVPALAWGRCVAMIEIIDADERLADRVADSTAYVAERLAEFLSERAAA